MTIRGIRQTVAPGTLLCRMSSGYGPVSAHAFYEVAARLAVQPPIAGAFDPVGAATAAIVAHDAEANPHPQYLTSASLPPGEDGEDGPMGPPGPPGISGADGRQGIDGFTIRGQDGEDGSDGMPGFPGAAGANGTNGAAGIQGVPGIQGDQGDDGSIGPPGNQGPTGATGSVGPSGADGLTIRGSDGDDGQDSYIPGPAGPAGAAGAGATWTEAEVDFGSTPVYDVLFTLTDAAITSSGVKVIILQSGKAATGRADGDAAWDEIDYAASPGTGSAQVWAKATPGPVVGKRKYQYQVA